MSCCRWRIDSGFVLSPTLFLIWISLPDFKNSSLSQATATHDILMRSIDDWVFHRLRWTNRILFLLKISERNRAIGVDFSSHRIQFLLAGLVCCHFNGMNKYYSDKNTAELNTFLKSQQKLSRFSVLKRWKSHLKYSIDNILKCVHGWSDTGII